MTKAEIEAKIDDHTRMGGDPLKAIALAILYLSKTLEEKREADVDN